MRKRKKLIPFCIFSVIFSFARKSHLFHQRRYFYATLVVLVKQLQFALILFIYILFWIVGQAVINECVKDRESAREFDGLKYIRKKGVRNIRTYVYEGKRVKFPPFWCVRTN